MNQNTTESPDPQDHSRLQFLATKAHYLPDLSEFEAKLIDDISENGEREITPFERSRTDGMIKRHKKLK